MCQFLSLSTTMPQRSQLLSVMSNSAGNSCVFNDILQLDFSKSKQAVDDYQERVKVQKSNFEEENKDA